MIAASGGDREADPDGRLKARLVHGEVLALDRDHVSRRAFANDLGGLRRAVGQDVAEALAVGNLQDHRHHRLGVAELEFDTAGVGGVDDAGFPPRHRRRDGHAGADGVQTVLVADLAGVGDSREIVNLAIAADRADGFVLRSAVLRRHLVVTILDLNHPLAADGAGETGFVLEQDVLGHTLAADVLPAAVKMTQLEVPGRQPAEVVKALQPAVGAVRLERGNPVVLGVVDPLGHVFERLRGGDLDVAVAAHRDGLQLLGAHHRGHAGASGGAGLVDDDPGDVRQLLTRRSDQREAHALVAHFLANPVLGGPTGLAPEVGGVANFDLVVHDRQVYGLVGDAGDDDPVPAGAFEFRSEVAADVGLAEAPGKRRFAADAVAAGAADRNPGERTVGDDQVIVGAEGVNGGRDFLQQVIRDHPGTAAICSIEDIAMLVDGSLAAT